MDILTKLDIKSELDKKILRVFMDDVKNEIHDALGTDCFDVARRHMGGTRIPVLRNRYSDLTEEIRHTKIQEVCKRIGYDYILNIGTHDDWFVVLPKNKFIVYKRKYIINLWMENN
jgi:hypothetical protein